MKRFFYTDSLAAAWMAKHFGMKFGIKHKGVVQWNCIGKLDEPFGPLQRPEDILDPISESVPLYIHPDSLHLLEPQVGDLFRFSNKGPIYECVCDVDKHVARIGYIPNPPQWELSQTKQYIGDLRFRIIQRNGASFMWPESEEV